MLLFAVTFSVLYVTADGVSVGHKCVEADRQACGRETKHSTFFSQLLIKPSW